MSGALRASRTWRVLLAPYVPAVLGITLQSLRLCGASYAAANPAATNASGIASIMFTTAGAVGAQGRGYGRRETSASAFESERKWWR